MSALNSNFSANLPDPLRIKPTGVQANQISVYEDFGISESSTLRRALIYTHQGWMESDTGRVDRHRQYPIPETMLLLIHHPLLSRQALLYLLLCPIQKQWIDSM